MSVSLQFVQLYFSYVHSFFVSNCQGKSHSFPVMKHNLIKDSGNAVVNTINSTLFLCTEVSFCARALSTFHCVQ